MFLKPTESVPSTVQFDSVPLEGVPRIGVTKVGLVLSTVLPEPVDVVTPVPPLATANVPANVTAPVVAVFGVNPVDPAENDVTPPPPVALSVPAENVKFVPIVTLLKPPDPLPYSIDVPDVAGA